MACYGGGFGTPTPRALSGTEEEFKRAYERFNADPNSVNLLIYFKEQPIPPSKINPGEIDRIQQFRKSLGSLGGLYWTFETVADFKALVRPHLAKVIQVWNARIKAQATEGSEMAESTRLVAMQNRIVTDAADESDEDELGYLDYMEIGERANSVMMVALKRMTAAMEELGANTRKRTAAADDLIASPNLTSAKAVANDTATDLIAFANKTAAEIPVLGEAYTEVLRAFSGAASIAIESHDAHDQVSNALSHVEQLRAALDGSKAQLLHFAGSLRSTPRMTTHLNRAKNKALRVLASLDAEFEKARSNSIMVEDSIRNLLTPKPD